jgi:glycolate oxidase FAD binding subunit
LSDPATALAGFASRIGEAARTHAPLRLRGAGTKDFYGQAVEGQILDTRGYAGIVDYDPTELVITARCGTPLATLEATMAERGQFLACEPPHFGIGTTVGGMVAAGLSGPRRAAAGAVRDFVLGVRLMNGRGEVLTFGGQVMKNVAGYDVSRLVAGSLGTLGLILEVSLKALPLPVAETTLVFELPEDRAIDQMNRWAAKPLPISATAHAGGELRVRLSGAAAAVRAARERIGGEIVAEETARAFWQGIREQTDAFFRTDLPLWRLSVPSTVAPLGVPGEQLVEWSGALRWLATNADARTIRAAAAKAAGHATLFRRGDRSIGVFEPLAPAIERLHQRLKRELDPDGIFNRSRMYPNL